MKIKEYRILLPMTAEECQIGILWTTGEVNKKNTGGGEGIEFFKSEEFTNNPNIFPGKTSGHYSKKIIKINSRVPWWVRALLPKGKKLDIYEEAWTSFPYAKNVLNSPDLMKDKFSVEIQTFMANDMGTQENVFNLLPDILKKREVVYIDIVNDPIPIKEYKESEDASKVQSVKTDRGPLGPNWMETTKPIMCVYKLLSIEIKIFVLQKKLENYAQETIQKWFNLMHRRTFCWIDQWYGLSYSEVRVIQEKIKLELNQNINKGSIQGDVFVDETNDSKNDKVE